MLFVAVNNYKIRNSMLQGLMKQSLQYLDNLKIEMAQVEVQV